MRLGEFIHGSVDHSHLRRVTVRDRDLISFFNEVRDILCALFYSDLLLRERGSERPVSQGDNNSFLHKMFSISAASFRAAYYLQRQVKVFTAAVCICEKITYRKFTIIYIKNQYRLTTVRKSLYSSLRTISAASRTHKRTQTVHLAGRLSFVNSSVHRGAR